MAVKANWLQPFTMADPFNGNSEVSGFLCSKPDHRYGALAITHVDGAPAFQIVAATPKLHYPFDRDGVFRFPPVKKVTVYDKLDGTNVLGFCYSDAEGQKRYSFKLRLSPFVRNGKYGAFLDLWSELLGRYPDLERLAARNGVNVSFEMYGARNTHLIEYCDDLEVVALFGVRDDWSVVPLYGLDVAAVPTPTVLADFRSGSDLVAEYDALRARMESTNRPGEDDRIVGTEGAILYTEDAHGAVSMWKCKPESVEAIHWATGINKTAVLATCHNVLETSDTLDFSTLKPLLLEEYDEEEIEKFRSHIDECIAQVNDHLAFVERVMTEYRATGLSVSADKGAVMRRLSSKFPRAEMKKVYSTIVNYEKANGA
ncbi:MAG: hypothetical protein AAFX94_07575 [Myxococcota bacterium]